LNRNGEIVIIGGGVIGLSVAQELLRRGETVRVLDRDDPEGVSTPAAAGMLAPVSEAELEDSEVLAFALDSLDRFPAYVASLETLTGHSCEYRTDGTLWVATSRDDEGELEHLRETLRLKELPYRDLTSDEVWEREPHLTGRVLGGLLVERDLQLDPRALMIALQTAVERAGGRIDRGVTVKEIRVSGGRVDGLVESHADGSRNERPATRVVLAAGAWSTATIVSPIDHVGVRPVKGQILRLRGERLLRHVMRHPDVYLVPREGGDLLVGATMEEMGFDARPTAGAAHDLLREAHEVLPGIYDLEIVEFSVGFRPMSRANRPAIGATDTEGLFAATGHGRQGVLMAPGTAHHLADAIVLGQTPAAIAPFAPGGTARVGAGSGA
jgi:glycine oxidase